MSMYGFHSATYFLPEKTDTSRKTNLIYFLRVVFLSPLEKLV